MPELYFAHEKLQGASGHECGRRLLRQLYEAHVGGVMPEIAIAPGGKPYFENCPWHFSISHTKNHAFCVLSSCPVGLDGEELTRQVNPILAEKALSPMEKAQYDSAADKNKALLTFWVLKEAAGKLSGRGVGIHPDHTGFMLTDSRVSEVDGCLVAILTQEDENHII